MRLATDADIVKLMGAVSNLGTLGNAAIALEVSAPVIAERLGTRLDVASYTDYFGYFIPRYRRAFAPIELRLAAGFVDADSVVVRESNNGLPLTDADSGDVVDSAEYLVNATQGIVKLLADRSTGDSSISIAYDAGFDVDTDSQVLLEIPDWLNKAGLYAAARVLQMNPAHFTHRRVPSILEIQNALMGEVTQILNPHIRPRGGFTWPERSTVEE